MKKRTRIASLVAAVAMTVSALPMAALPALAIQTTTEGDHGTLTNAVYQIRKAPDNLHAPASDSNPAQNLVEISRDDLAKGDYTFKAAAYIKADGQMTDDDFVSTISMKWQASNYKYMRFAEDDYTSVIPMETYELSDGTKFNATLRPFSLAKITHSPKKGDGYFTPLWRVVTNETAVEPCTGTPVYSAGPNKIKFTCTYYTEGQYKSPDSKVIVPVESSKTTKEFTLDLTVDEETNTATYDFQVPQQGTQPGAYPMFAYHGVIHNYDSSTPEGQVINGDNDMIRMQYGEDNGTKWLDGKSDSYPIMTFDVTMSKDTPDGYYYVNFDTESGSPYIEDNQSIILKMNRMVRAYKENGKSLVETIYPTGLEDKSNFLTIKVGDAKETTATTTATTTTSAAETTTTVSETTVPVTTAATTAATTAPATSSEAPTTTTTNGLVVGNEPTMAVNNGQKIFATPGQEYAEIPLNLYNVPDTEGITVAFKTDAEGTPTLALLKDAYQLYEAADAFVNLGKWEANPKGLSWGVPSSGKQMVKGSDFVNGDVFLSLYYNIPDEETVKSIAKANNLELKQDAEHGTYYEFPLVFEREKLNNKDGKLLDWVGTNNTKISATYVDGSICIPVTGVEPTTTTAVTTTTPAGSTATTTKTELTVNGPTMAVNKGEDVVVTPGQEYAEIPLNLYNVPDTEGITVAFKTDAEGTPTLALLKDAYQLYEAADAFVNLGKWEANPKGLSWGVPSSGKQMVKSGDFADGDVFLSLYYNIPDEATVKDIAEANGLELKHNAEYGAYYEFPLVFEREKLNNKDGKLLDWVGTNNTKISATYVDGSICIPVTGVKPTTTTAVTTTTPAGSTATTTKTELTVNGPTMAVNKGEDVVVTPGQEYAEIPLNLYNVPDTEGITVAFKTDSVGTPTLALLKDAYQLYEAADAFVNLGKWEANPKGLSWGVPSSGKQMVKSGTFADGDVFLSLYYNIPDEATVEKIAEANNLELKHNSEYGAYYEFPLVFEREKLNNKDGKLLDWVGTNNTKVNATYVDSNLIVKVTDTQTTTTTGATTTSTTTTTTTDSGIKDPTAPRMEVRGDKKNDHKIVVTPGQEYAEIPLSLYNVPDTEGITVAFKTDGVGTPTLALLKDSYQLYEAADAFVNLGKWEANPKGLSWGVPSSGKQMVKGSDFADGDVFLSLYYNIPDEATVEKIAEANNLELKQDDEYGYYYEFPLVFEREKLNNKDGKLLDWVGTNNTKINAEYVDGSLIVKMSDVTTTTTTTGTTTSTTTTTTTFDPTVPRMEVYGEENGEKKNHKVVVTPGQEYAEIPLNLYNVPDTEGITVAFKTDGEGTPTLALLKDSYQLYEAADAFVNLGKWEANPKGLSWGVPSSGKQMVKSGDFADGDVFLSLYYNIPDEATVKDIAKANGMELKHDDEYGAYYEFPLIFEREKLNNKDGKLLDWVGTNNTKINAIYVDGSIIVKMPDETTTTTTTTGTTTTTVTTTTADSTTSGSATTTSGAATTTSGSAETTSATTGTDNTGETTTTTKGQLVPLYGDVNVNGQVTIVDVVLLNKAIAGKVTLSEQAFLNADCGNVDQVLDEHDLNALMQYLVGIVQQLPGEAK